MMTIRPQPPRVPAALSFPPLLALVLFPLLVLGRPLSAQGTTEGVLEGNIRYQGPESGPVVVRLYAMGGEGGGAGRLSKARILEGPAADRTVVLPGAGAYRIPGLVEGRYSVVAFMDLDGDEALDFARPEPLGWYASEAGGWVGVLDLTRGGLDGVDVTLRTPTPFPSKERRVEHGALRWMEGLPVLQLRGTPEERGYAHGYLVGPQIVDFFEFYVLEDSWRSAWRYQEEFVPFLESNFDYDPEYLAEVDAVIRGMEASEMEMGVQWLGRDFQRVDLLAINAYIERRAARPSPPADPRPLPAPAPEPSPATDARSWTRSAPVQGAWESGGWTLPSAPPEAAGPACSQFAFWGDATRGTELDGGLIAGRNMDGEVDLRKVTVSHFLVFAVDPEQEGRRRWVSTMWPGFVGTISGVNEDGLYSMENAGGTGPGPVVDGLTPCTWVQRHILETAGAESTPASVGADINGFRSAGGGAFGAGSVILWAVPYRGQPAPAFVSEGDRFGTAVRTPGEVAPTRPWDIVATNHYMTYGVDPSRPGFYFGKPASFSSLWRYEVGMNTLEAWGRQEKPLGTEEMRRLLQSAAHGTTEYSVIFRANEMTLEVAVDDLATDMWDAPYQEWATFHFEDLFRGME